MPAGQDRALLERLTGDEWTAVAALAVRQRVGPLLYSRADLPIPAEVRATLRTRAEQTARRTLQLQAALRELAAQLAPLGVPLVVLKGMHLALAAYPSAGVREMADIDVLVPPAAVQPLLDQAGALGYQLAVQIPLALALQTRHELQIGRGPIRWDIHWRLAAPGSPPHVSADELLTRATPCSLAGGVRTLSREDAFVHVCAHAAGDTPFEQGIRSLCDIAYMTTAWSGELAWEDIMTRSRAWRCERGVTLTLAMARHALGAVVPAHVQRWLEAEGPPAEILRIALAQATATGQTITPTGPGRLLDEGTLWSKLRASIAAATLPDAELTLLYPWHTRHPLSRAAAITARAASLTRRYAWQLLRARLRPGDALGQTLARRHAVSGWLRGDTRRG